MKSLSLNMNLNQCLITILWIRPLYVIKGQTSQIGLGLCKCRQAGFTDEIQIATQGSSRCKDGGRGTVMMGLDNRGGVMLWILNVNGVFTEGFNWCHTMERNGEKRLLLKQFNLQQDLRYGEPQYFLSGLFKIDT